MYIYIYGFLSDFMYTIYASTLTKQYFCHRCMYRLKEKNAKYCGTSLQSTTYNYELFHAIMRIHVYFMTILDR